MNFSQVIIEEHPQWMAINKPSGWIVEKNPYEKPTIEDLARDYLAQNSKKPFLGIVHRLDRVTSGLLLLAKKKQALRQLNAQFADRSIKKVYWAITHQALPSEAGKLKHHLEKDQKSKRALIYKAASTKTSEVSLTYKLLAQKESLFLWEVIPHSGKFHQIRAQLAAEACPIVGDEKYGSPIDPAHRHIALHARNLSFNEPLSGKRITIEAEIPHYKWWLAFQ